MNPTVTKPSLCHTFVCIESDFYSFLLCIFYFINDNYLKISISGTPGTNCFIHKNVKWQLLEIGTQRPLKNTKKKKAVVNI